MTDVFASLRGPIEPRPFDVEPLLAVAGEPSLSRAALRLGVRQSTLSRAVALGITWRQADAWACRLRQHPAEVWPDTWWADIDFDDSSEDDS